MQSVQPLRLGDTGPVVAEIRATLTSLGLLAQPAGAGRLPRYDLACDRAVRGFQQSRGLSVDGVVGPETYRALDEARWRLGDRLLSMRVAHPFVGDDVAELQHRLQELGFDPGRCDGVFGARTEQAVRELQRNLGLVPDGTCGPHTLKALDRLRRTVVGGRAQWIREAEELVRAGPSVAGKFVIIDPGHGGPDRGFGAAGCLDEATVADDLAARLEGRLAASGAFPFLTRGPDAAPDDTERAAFANAAEGDLLVSLHCDAAPHPACNGVATYYFGSYGPGGQLHESSVGKRFAALVQREITTRTDLLDCATHPKTWDLLRLTRMPAVRVELGYLSNAGDAARLSAPEFRDAVAEAILAAIQRLYAPPDIDGTSEQLRVPILVG
ncbi:MAG: N-acetylmuramoyl-L-alanine amidase [Frankiaceae bacterium]